MKIIQKLSQLTKEICRIQKKLQRAKAKKLAQKRISDAIFLSLLIPIVGYIYTGRLIPFFLYCLSLIIYNFFLPRIEDLDIVLFLYFLPVLCSAIDNAWSINCARKKQDVIAAHLDKN